MSKRNPYPSSICKRCRIKHQHFVRGQLVLYCEHSETLAFKPEPDGKWVALWPMDLTEAGLFAAFGAQAAMDALPVTDAVAGAAFINVIKEKAGETRR